MDSKQALNLLRKSGVEPALPFLIFSDSGVEYANKRMIELLRPIDNKLVSQDDLERVWPFFNEFQSPVALFKEITSAKIFRDTEEIVIYGEAFLKTFRIHVRKQEDLRIIACEMVRSGDLLADEEARQVLFRSISHEIRTAAMALRGYTDMVEDRCAELARIEIDGLRNSLRRLDGVVRRLDDFKTELKVDLDDSKQKTVKKKAG